MPCWGQEEWRRRLALDFKLGCISPVARSHLETQHFGLSLIDVIIGALGVTQFITNAVMPSVVINIPPRWGAVTGVARHGFKTASFCQLEGG